jgi:peptidoglycan/xylan/chitin deacetylase (PgdA/CDA1 family)
MNTYKAVIGDCISALSKAVIPTKSLDHYCRILMYHAVGTDVPGDIHQLYNMPLKTFRLQIEHLSRLQQSGLICVRDLNAGVETSSGLVITFDDGYRDNFTAAAPILTSYGLPFTIFVPPKLILDGDSRYLSIVTLKELALLPGVTIGGHGYSHRPLTNLDDGALANELRGSRAWLEDIIQKPVVTMSYPHGAVDERVRAFAADAGYEVAASSNFGALNGGCDSLWLPRTDIWAQDGLSRFKSKLAGSWDWMSHFDYGK